LRVLVEQLTEDWTEEEWDYDAVAPWDEPRE
jgi:hypothetical protein